MAVPQFPGVPALSKAVQRLPTPARAVLSASQGALWRIFQISSAWGVYDKNGKPLVSPSKFQDLKQAVGLGATLSTNSVSYNKEYRVATYPVERGKLAAYNKVETPGQATVVLCFSGNLAERKAFLDALDAAAASLEPYSVVTPEATYTNYTIDKYSYNRESYRGANLLIVELSLSQVRSVTATFTTREVAKPESKPAEDGGKKQPVKASNSVLSQLSKSSLIEKVESALSSFGKWTLGGILGK